MFGLFIAFPHQRRLMMAVWAALGVADALKWQKLCVQFVTATPTKLKQPCLAHQEVWRERISDPLARCLIARVSKTACHIEIGKEVLIVAMRQRRFRFSLFDSTEMVSTATSI